jgi:hypothetical protein
MAYPRFGIGRLGVAAIGRCGDTVRRSMLHEMKTVGGDRMRAKLSGLKHLLYTAAALATLALAAGARYKPH